MSVQEFWAAKHITSNFGDSRDGGARKHRGTDYSHGRGTPIPAPFAGKVTGKLAPATTHGFGYQVTITAASGEVYSFAHMNAASPLAIGEAVSVGEIIGFEGSTGATTGPCVHVEYNRGGFSNPAPQIARLIAGDSAPAPAASGALVVDGNMQEKTISRWQQVMGTPVDGKITSPRSALVVAVQNRINGAGYRPLLTVDGAGIAQNNSKTKTIDGLQWYLGTQRDGRLTPGDSGAVRALQTRLNEGRF